MMGFGSLYYTDCRPGEGLLGSSGFQFQATSGDIESDIRDLVKRGALYEPPSIWMRELRPVECYPRSLAHVSDGSRYITAAGHYLGKEAGGIRQGNHFTHAIVTDDRSSYGLTRPAQLWGALWWSDKPAPTTVCDPIPAEPPPGPWNAHAVRDRLSEYPDAEGSLVALLSALHELPDPNRMRILIVSDDAETAVVWIAAATLLMPINDALDVSFKVYSTSPHYSPHHIFAAHPEWAGPLTTSSSFAVFDLVEGRHTLITPTESAKFWVPRFLERDPFDVVDAVEFAGIHGRTATQIRSGNIGQPTSLGRPDSASTRLAAMAVAAGERAATTADAAQLANWLAEVPPETAKLVAKAVVGAVLNGVHDAPSLRTLDRAVHGRGVPALAASVRPALAEAEVLEMFRATGQQDMHQNALAPAEGTECDNKAVVSIIERGLASARPEQLASLLTLARRFRVAPQIGKFLDSAHEFVRWWADNPDTALDSSRREAELIDLLRDELSLRLTDHRRTDTEGAIYSYWWRLLWTTVIDPADSLDSLVIDAGTRQGDSTSRYEAQLAALYRGGADFAWRVVFGELEPDAVSVLRFFRDLPAGVAISSTLANRAYQAIRDSPELSRDILDVLRYVRSMWPPPSECDRSITWAKEDAKLQQMISGLRKLSIEAARETARQLTETSLELLAARLDELSDALLQRDPQILECVLLGAGPSVRQLLIPELERRWKQVGRNPKIDSPDGNCAAAAVFLVSTNPEVGDNEADGLAKRLAAAIPHMGPRQRDDVARLLPATEIDDWWTWVADVTRASPRGLRARGTAMISKERWKRHQITSDDTGISDKRPWWQFRKK